MLEKKGKQSEFGNVLQKIKDNNKFSIVSLDMAIVEMFTKVTPQLSIHDRIIVATASLINAPILTRDVLIQKHYLRTIW